MEAGHITTMYFLLEKKQKELKEAWSAHYIESLLGSKLIVTD